MTDAQILDRENDKAYKCVFIASTVKKRRKGSSMNENSKYLMDLCMT